MCSTSTGSVIRDLSPVSVLAADIPVPSLGSSDSDKENSSQGSFESAQQAVNKLVEIVEADLKVNNKEARILSNVMDAKVRSHLFQRCKLKKHPHWFAPFPKGWKADRAHEQRQTFQPRLKINWEIFVRTWNLSGPLFP